MDILVLKPGATEEQLKHITKKLESRGLQAHVSKGTERTIIGVIGDTSRISEDEENAIRAMPGVEDALRILKPYKLASREFKTEDTRIEVRGDLIGGRKIQVFAGPCAVENKTILMSIAQKVKDAGAVFIRGERLSLAHRHILFRASEKRGEISCICEKKLGMPVITEIIDPRDMKVVSKYTDIIQIGTRNMQNFRLLLEVGTAKKPVLLKRGLSATIKEWLMAAEYIMSKGNQGMKLCERGIRTFETATRNTLDLSAVPVLKKLTHLPVVVDPSHGVGKWDLVAPMAKAAVAAGADGLIIEVHTNPEEAFSDGEQSLRPDDFKKLMKELKPVAAAVGREI